MAEQNPEETRGIRVRSEKDLETALSQAPVLIQDPSQHKTEKIKYAVNTAGGIEIPSQKPNDSYEVMAEQKIHTRDGVKHDTVRIELGNEFMMDYLAKYSMNFVVGEVTERTLKYLHTLKEDSDERSKNAQLSDTQIDEMLKFKDGDIVHILAVWYKLHGEEKPHSLIDNGYENGLPSLDYKVSKTPEGHLVGLPAITDTGHGEQKAQYPETVADFLRDHPKIKKLTPEEMSELRVWVQLGQKSDPRANQTMAEQIKRAESLLQKEHSKETGVVSMLLDEEEIKKLQGKKPEIKKRVEDEFPFVP